MNKNAISNYDEQQIEANKIAWGTLSKEHYEHFKSRLAEDGFKLNPMVDKELGNVEGKRILHLQCNTGADSILLARKGAIVTGVDLVPDNIRFARRLAKDFDVKNIQFIESDILKLAEVHTGTYDIVMTTDGAIGWLPDLNKWGKVLERFLSREGFFYFHDCHPFMGIFDEQALENGELIPKYPYFQQHADREAYIGGYASDTKTAENYFWGHQLSTIVNGLLNGGLYITYFNEYDRCAPGMGGTRTDDKGLSYYPELAGKLPLVISLKAQKK